MCFQLFDSVQTGETKRIIIEQVSYKLEYKTAPNKRRLPLFFFWLGCLENRLSKFRKGNKTNTFSGNHI